MENTYLLLHKEIPVAVIQMDLDTGTIIDIGKNVNIPYLPVMCTSNHYLLKQWWENRSIPVTRQALQHDLIKGGVSTPKELLIKNMGLSLTDSYWIKPIDSDYTWETVNLYQNSFSDSIITLNISNMPMDLKAVSAFIPSASLQGELKKKWVILNGDRVLVKGNYGKNNQQSINEVFASSLHEKQGSFPYTPYWLVEIESEEGRTIGCACKNFCDKDTEFVPAYQIASSYKKNNDISEYEAYISYCEQKGVDIRSFMEYQIATDFILTNTDRHFNNFGLLRNSDTLKFTGPAPIFDNGNCLFYNSLVPVGKDLLEIKVTSFRNKECDLLRYIRKPEVLDLKKLPSVEDLYQTLKKCKNKKETKRDAICSAYAAKISMYDDFLNGAKIWEYQYRKGIGKKGIVRRKKSFPEEENTLAKKKSVKQQNEPELDR